MGIFDFLKKDKKVPPAEEPAKREAAPDPFKILEAIDNAERQKYPEAIRNIKLSDVKKRAKQRREEIYNSHNSFDDEKELIDIAVKVFSDRDSLAKTPSYVAKAALKLIGYDEELADPLYKMLYEEATRVYNVLAP